MFCRFSLFAAVVSMLCGGLVFFLFRSPVFRKSEVPNYETPDRGGTYAVLALDESQDDRRIRELLARGGMEDFISESSQELAVDDFGALKMVPLDYYRNEVELFDPRDDGYAQALRSFFVRDGKRFFFLFLEDTTGRGAAKLKKEISSLLSDVPFKLTILRQGQSFFWYFALLSAACVFTLRLSHSRRLYVFQLPVLLAFGWGGSSAFVLAAALTGIWELLREPLGELSASRRYDRNYIDYAGAGFKGLWERLKPFRVNCVLVLPFVIFLALFSFAAELPPVPLAAGCGGFFLLYFLAFRLEAERIKKSRHILFTPVPLLPIRTRTFSLFPLLLPFAAAAALASAMTVFFPFFFPAFSPLRPGEALINTRYLINTDDYYRHLDFQRSFSYRSLNEAGPVSGALNQEGYLRYYLGGDGLIAGSTDHPGAAPPSGQVPADLPPFPLEKLMGFLVDYNGAGKTGAAGETPDVRIMGSLFRFEEWVSAVFILAACMMNLLRPGIRSQKKKKVPFFGDKRIAA